jgi:hypothetical protein
MSRSDTSRRRVKFLGLVGDVARGVVFGGRSAEVVTR